LVRIWAFQQGLSTGRVATIGFCFTMSKATAQLLFSALADAWQRKRILLGGFSVAAVGIAVLGLAGLRRGGGGGGGDGAAGGALASGDSIFALLSVGGFVVGAGIGAVYPVMEAAMCDHSAPASRATSMGVYKLFRDSGYAFGGLISGGVQDAAHSFMVTSFVVAGLTAGTVVLIWRQYVERYNPGPRMCAWGLRRHQQLAD
jgi:MFS family permease